MLHPFFSFSVPPGREGVTYAITRENEGERMYIYIARSESSLIIAVL